MDQCKIIIFFPLHNEFLDLDAVFSDLDKEFIPNKWHFFTLKMALSYPISGTFIP